MLFIAEEKLPFLFLLHAWPKNMIRTQRRHFHEYMVYCLKNHYSKLLKQWFFDLTLYQKYFFHFSNHFFIFFNHKLNFSKSFASSVLQLHSLDVVILWTEYVVFLYFSLFFCWTLVVSWCFCTIVQLLFFAGYACFLLKCWMCNEKEILLEDDVILFHFPGLPCANHPIYHSNTFFDVKMSFSGLYHFLLWSSFFMDEEGCKMVNQAENVPKGSDP